MDSSPQPLHVSLFPRAYPNFSAGAPILQTATEAKHKTRSQTFPRCRPMRWCQRVRLYVPFHKRLLLRTGSAEIRAERTRWETGIRRQEKPGRNSQGGQQRKGLQEQDSRLRYRWISRQGDQRIPGGTSGVMGPGPGGKGTISQACQCRNVIEQCFTELWEHVGGLRC